MAKKSKPPPRTAADARRVVKVERILDTVRIVDTIEAMHKRNQISDSQRRAAEIFRTAYEDQFVGLTGTLDPDKVGGAMVHGAPPPEAALLAAETVRQAREKLGVRDYAIVERIVGRGYAIEACALTLYGKDRRGKVRRDDKLATGRRLRESLDTLVALYKVEAKGAKIRAVRHETPDAAYAEEGELNSTGRVAHAGRGKVDWSGK